MVVLSKEGKNYKPARTEKEGRPTQEQLKKATKITIKTYRGDETGKFGRILGEIWYGGKHNVNQLLIDNHHAVRYHGQSKEDIAEEHLKNRELVKL